MTDLRTRARRDAIRGILAQYGSEYPCKKVCIQLRLLGFQFSRGAASILITQQRTLVRQRCAEQWKPVFDEMKRKSQLAPRLASSARPGLLVAGSPQPADSPKQQLLWR